MNGGLMNPVNNLMNNELMNNKLMNNELINNKYLPLRSKKLFVLDMDGTFYLGDRILEGSLDFVKRIRESDRRFMFFTNNASKTPEYYMGKLKKMGCDINREDIVTSGDVTIEYLLKKYPGGKVYLVGTPLLEESFRKAGINLVSLVSEERAEVGVVSFDLTLTYEKVSRACDFIRKGAVFIATHMDLNCPTEQGPIPDCGSICAMITASTGIKPKYLGKPFNETIGAILRISGCRTDEMAIIGDRLYTDIAMGYKNGVTSILVLTGETRMEDVEKSEIKPDFIFPSLGSLAKVL